MIIGIPREIMNNEYRVGLLQVHVEALRGAGHTVFVETKAGEGSGAHDGDYRDAGASIVQLRRQRGWLLLYDLWGDYPVLFLCPQPIP